MKDLVHRKKKVVKKEKAPKPEGIILVISDGKAFMGTGLAFEIMLQDEKSKRALYGKRIGQLLDGSEIGLPGYTFSISGATDKFGFPHNPSIISTELRKVSLTEPPGIRFYRYKVEKRGGGYKLIDNRKVYRKKTVRGAIISEYTRQINLTIVSRSGQSIKEMSAESIMSDRILSKLVEKIGMQVLKNGLQRVRYIEDGQVVSLQEKLKELGFDEDILKKLSIELGIKIIKRGRRFIETVIKPVLKVRGNTPFAKYIGKILHELYQDLKEGKVSIENADAIIANLRDKILEGAEKAFNNELKVEFKFKIKSAAASA